MHSVIGAFSNLWSKPTPPQATEDAPSGASSQECKDCPPSLGHKLGRSLKKMETFLPTSEVKNFNPGNITLKFDVKHLDATNLSSLYDTMASSFWFSRDVQELYVEHKGSFTLVSPDFKGTKNEALCRCLKMAELINKIAPDAMDRNLKMVWKKLEAQYQFPHFTTTDEMRQYLENEKHTLDVTLLDLSRSDIEILPPEILKFPNLSQVILYDTNLGQFPHILSAHSKLDLNKIHCEDLTFTKGTSTAQGAKAEKSDAPLSDTRPKRASRGCRR
ncbi:leucine-rich repeat domain-containing protein [Simkania sp.]|uniref:leucine-rich repeat domain-containing protein n=1 Tax=Simkania sp. TaxID=34094 RepID=UPI003B51FF74